MDILKKMYQSGSSGIIGLRLKDQTEAVIANPWVADGGILRKSAHRRSSEDKRPSE